MSRLARTPISAAAGTTVAVAADGSVTVKGALGELRLAGNHNVKVEVDGDKVAVRRTRDTKHARSLEGTYVRRLVNMLVGVTEGFTRTIELHGTGYRAALQGSRLELELGYSHPVSYELPGGVAAETPAPNQIVLRGIDKVQVGQVAADIRGKRPPEPYKGKGARYAGERIITKVTKKK